MGIGGVLLHIGSRSKLFVAGGERKTACTPFSSVENLDLRLMMWWR